ncbi:MAG: 50S ribosomal protein L4 [Patescibacteria group bacterium]
MAEINKTISVIDSEAKQVEQMAIPSEAQTIKVNQHLLHQVIVAYEANKRAGTAHTKTRAEVAGGGRKPWKQKGTGRARHGSIRSPLWKGGGVTFGPRSERNYQQKINKQSKVRALKMVISERLLNNQLVVCQSYPQELKTKVFAGWLKKIGLANKKLLVILSDDEKKVIRGLQNISKVELVSLRSVNPYDLIKKPHWLISQNSVKLLFKNVYKV